MKLGFSGTQEGMTEEQKIITTAVIGAWAVEGDITEFHHGCCWGADENFHKIVRLMFPKIAIVCHPPTNKNKVARWTMDDCDELWLPKPYLVRNEDIADVCDRLIATPKEDEMVLRSGTWSTVRYFLKRDKRVCKILPSGKMEIAYETS